MYQGLRELALHYFEEVANNPNNKNPEELATMADNFVKDVRKWFAARLDFKEESNG